MADVTEPEPQMQGADEITSSAPAVPPPAGPVPPVSGEITNVQNSTRAYLQRHPWPLIIACIIMVSLWVLLAVFRMPSATIYFFTLLIPALVVGSAQRRVQQEFMEQFAAENGYSFMAKGGLAGLDGALFRIGDSRRVTNVVQGNFKNIPLALFNYCYSVGFGRNRRTYPYTVFEFQLDTAMPDVLLLNHMGGFAGESFVTLGKLERLELEGDFSKYFFLSVAKGYEIEALEVFTPDVMEKLMDKAQTLSLEIVHNHLYVYAARTIMTKDDLGVVYELARYFVEELGPVLARMKSGLQAMAAEAAAEGGGATP